MKPIIRFAATLSAFFLGICCTEELDVIEVSSITINTKSVNMFIGETLQLEATVEPKDATDKEVTWRSSDETVVSVSSTGLVSALKDGNAVITALAGKCVSVCTVSVTRKTIEVASIELNRATAALAIGETIQLVATVKPDDATDKTVEWFSSNNEVATVDNDGKVTSIKEGSTTITAKAGGKTAECAVTVVSNKVEVTSISLDKTTISLKEGETVQLVATVKPDNATDKTVEWSSSNDNVASIDKAGIVTAIAEGSTTITAKAGDKTAKCEVKVISGKIEVSSVELNRTSITLSVGETFALVPTIKPDDATDKTVTWSSSSESIATVDKNGNIHAVNEGTATITATAGKKSATCEVTVVTNKVEVTSIELDQSSISLKEGETIQLIATVKPDNATDKTVDWSSSNENIATVDENGLVTAVFQGSVIISAKAGKATASCTVTVISYNFKPNGKYLSFTGLASKSSISLKGNTEVYIEYSYDTVNWYPWAYSKNYYESEGSYSEIQLATGTKVYIRGKDWPEDASHRFVFGDKVAAGGNLMSLFFYDNFENQSGFDKKYKCLRTLFRANTRLVEAPDLPATTLFDHCYEEMFIGCNALASAPDLPATVLTNECYRYMFYNCQNLTKGPEILPATVLAGACYLGMFAYTHLTDAPVLPATLLVGGCYKYMFVECSTLTKAPDLPATVLADSCYDQMFAGCRRLTKAPDLPATTLAGNCYTNMFLDCDSLISAPELPATTLAKDCYSGMFNHCSNLTQAPALPATELAESCYSEMFRRCSRITSAPSLPATTLAKSCYSEMFYGCSSLSNAPELPATRLGDNCYTGMFNGCTGLTAAPVLRATHLVKECYTGMFSDCSGLTSTPDLPATELAERCYCGMFSGCTSLTKAPAILPATTLAYACYSDMFSGCSSLTSAPSLPATKLEESCYNGMFSGCSSLTSAPSLPATILVKECYTGMFSDCSGLTSAPSLPAIKLEESCYNSMFSRCRSLTAAPELPATTLAKDCYSGMFYHCSNITQAPALPATTLAYACYSDMFSGCTSLTRAPVLPAITLFANGNHYSNMFKDCPKLEYIKMMAVNFPDYSSFHGWVDNVASKGTFVKSASANWDESKVIPKGWTVQTATE